MKSRSGEITLAKVLIIALVGGLGFLAFKKPKAMDGASRKAAASQKATADLQAAHEAELAALKAKSASASAGVSTIGKVAEGLPATPTKDAIAAEVEVVRSRLEPADAAETIAAERRANAILSGNIAEARRLNALAHAQTSALQTRLVEAETRTAKAEAAREAVDLQLSEAAARALGAEQASNRWKFALFALALVYLYTKLTHLGPGALAEAAKDMKTGTPGVQALDSVTTRFQQKIARFLQKHF
jgi:hypothetical protein